MQTPSVGTITVLPNGLLTSNIFGIIVSVMATRSLVILLGIIVITFVNSSTVVALDTFRAVRSGEAQCNETDIRLAGGSSPMDGRVEVCLGGQWGTVCDDFWNQPDAIVVCRQLGFPTEGAQAFKRYYYGDDSVPIHFTDVSCAGNELLLVNCTHNPNHNCMHSQDAGVLCGGAQCAVGQIRLVNGSSPNEGRVEVCYRGVWVTVCDNFWSYLDAVVVCRQLGYSPSGATGVRGGAFGAGSGPIIGTVHCSGSELTLLSCTINSNNCNHDSDAGVQCHGSITFSSSSLLTASTVMSSSSVLVTTIIPTSLITTIIPTSLTTTIIPTSLTTTIIPTLLSTTIIPTSLTTTIIPTSLTTTIIPTSLTTTIIPTSLTTTIIPTPIITRVSSTITTSSVSATSSTTTTRVLTPTLTPTATSVSSTTTKPPTSSISTLSSPTSSPVTIVTNIPTPSTSRPISTTAPIVTTTIPPAMSSSPIGGSPGQQTLSGGAIAGIVIGVIVFVVIIIILIGFSMCVVFVRIRNNWIHSLTGSDTIQLQPAEEFTENSSL